MAGGFNRVTLIGNLGDEPQVRQAQTGTSVATLNLAINEYRRDQNGNRTETTEWVRVVAFGKVAETAGQYLHKGSQVHIEGKLRTRSYDDKDGNKRYITEVVCDPAGLLMLGSKSPRDDGYSDSQSSYSSDSYGSSGYNQQNSYANSNQNNNLNSHGYARPQQPQNPYNQATAQQPSAQPSYGNNGYNSQPIANSQQPYGNNGYNSQQNTYAQNNAQPYQNTQNNGFTQNPDNVEGQFQDDNDLPF